MYAIIESGGKQHKVFEGDVVRLEKLEADAGDKVNFSNVLMIADGGNVTVGAPYVDNIQVTAEVVEQTRGDKIRIVKFKRRKHHQKATGHRQYYTDVKITGIETGKAKAKPAAKAEEAQPAETKTDEAVEAKSTAKKPAAKKTAAKTPAKKAPAKKAPAKKAAASKSKTSTAKKAGTAKKATAKKSEEGKSEE